MTTKLCTALLLAVIILATPSAAQVKVGTKEGTLESALSMLNLFEEQPQPVLSFYTAAYTILAADPHATFMDVSADPGVQRIISECGMTHFGGPLLGSISSESASVWLRTLQPAAVEVVVTIDGEEVLFGPVRSSAESDLTAVVSVTTLKPSTRYPYRVLVDGEPIAMPGDAVITTAPPDSETGTVRIAFGSCFHRWGIANPDQAERIRSRQPAALLLIGDIAVQDRNNDLGLHRADYLLRDCHPSWQGLVANIPVFASWDDHDYFDNDKAGIPPGYTGEDRVGVRRVFTQAWANPAYGFGDKKGGVFLRTRIGPCDIVMTDNRYFREDTEGSFLGDEQMRWLEEQLLDCRGPFIILSCGTMWSDFVSGGKDSWGRLDPEGRERIFSLIEKHRIGGVLLISGDRHGARGFRIPRPSGFSFHEFEAASLGGRKGPAVTDPEWTTQLYGFESVYAFGEFTIDATLDDPEVTYRLIQDDGAELYSITLKRSQLTPPGD